MSMNLEKAPSALDLPSGQSTIKAKVDVIYAIEALPPEYSYSATDNVY